MNIFQRNFDWNEEKEEKIEALESWKSRLSFEIHPQLDASDFQTNFTSYFLISVLIDLLFEIGESWSLRSTQSAGRIKMSLIWKINPFVGNGGPFWPKIGASSCWRQQRGRRRTDGRSMSRAYTYVVSGACIPVYIGSVAAARKGWRHRVYALHYALLFPRY